MANNCTIQIVNCTTSQLLAMESHEHQMSKGGWAFSNIGKQNWHMFPVEFWDGHGDDGDGGWQNFGIAPGGDVLQLVAVSDDHSNHYLKYTALGDPSSTLVFVMNSTGTILNTLEPNDLQWCSPTTAMRGQLLIGELTSDQAVFGLGLVDLSMLFTEPAELKDYLAAIAAGNLTYSQNTTLQEKLDGAFGSAVSTDER